MNGAGGNSHRRICRLFKQGEDGVVARLARTRGLAILRARLNNKERLVATTFSDSEDEPNSGCTHLSRTAAAHTPPTQPTVVSPPPPAERPTAPHAALRLSVRHPYGRDEVLDLPALRFRRVVRSIRQSLQCPPEMLRRGRGRQCGVKLHEAEGHKERRLRVPNGRHPLVTLLLVHYES